MQHKIFTHLKILTAVSLLALLAVPVFSDTVEPESSHLKSPTEVYLGGGRACAGKLMINAKTLSWMTPFSHCVDQPYTLVALRSNNNALKNRVLQLSKPSAKCLYHFINIKTTPETGQVQVAGFKSIEDYEQQNFDAALICPVVAQ